MHQMQEISRVQVWQSAALVHVLNGLADDVSKQTSNKTMKNNRF